MAAAILMFQLTGSALMVGVISIVQFAGPLVLSLWAGALTDRLDRRRLLMASRGLAAVSASVLAILLAALGVEGFGGVPVLLICTGLLGIALGIGSPAMQALVPNLVPPRQLEQAIALNAVVGNIARAIGPALGAILIATGGPGLAFGVAASGHWLWMLALATVTSKAPTSWKGKRHLLGGITYIRQDRNAARLLVAVAALTFAIDPVITLTPSLAARLDDGAELVGVLASAFGIGAIAVTGLIGFLRARMTLRVLGMIGMSVSAFGLFTIGVSHSATLGVIGFLLTGAGFMLANTALVTRIQRRVPEELRGRVMALWTLAFLGTRPIAAALNGYLTDNASISWALGAGAVICLGGAYLSRASYRG